MGDELGYYDDRSNLNQYLPSKSTDDQSGRFNFDPLLVESNSEPSAGASNNLVNNSIMFDNPDASISFVDIKKHKHALIEKNWRSGMYNETSIDIPNENQAKTGVYCLQYDNEKIIAGLRNNNINIWKIENAFNYKPIQTLIGHSGSVLCLQFDNIKIISGSSDSTIRVWNAANGNPINTLNVHKGRVSSLRFSNNVMVTCSDDQSILLFDITDLNNIYSLKNLTLDPRIANLDLRCNAVDMNSSFVVAGLFNKIKVWENKMGYELISSLNGHENIITCLIIALDRYVISGSQDKTVRVWDVVKKNCIRVLEGHSDFICCIRCDERRVLTGSY